MLMRVERHYAIAKPHAKGVCLCHGAGLLFLGHGPSPTIPPPLWHMSGFSDALFFCQTSYRWPFTLEL